MQRKLIVQFLVINCKANQILRFRRLRVGPLRSAHRPTIIYSWNSAGPDSNSILINRLDDCYMEVVSRAFYLDIILDVNKKAVTAF
jgi:hypothetical protein